MPTTCLSETAYKLADADLADRVTAAAEAQRDLGNRAYALGASLGPTVQVRFIPGPSESHFTRTILRSLTVPESLPEGWVHIKNRKTVEPARKGPGVEAATAALESIQPGPDQPRIVLAAAGLPEGTDDQLVDGRIRSFNYAWFVHDGALYAKFHAGTFRGEVAERWEEIPVAAWHRAREEREVAEVMASRAA